MTANSVDQDERATSSTEAKRGKTKKGREPAITAMHGPHSVFDFGHCTVIHCDAGGMSLIEQ